MSEKHFSFTKSDLAGAVNERKPVADQKWVKVCIASVKLDEKPADGKELSPLERFAGLLVGTGYRDKVSQRGLAGQGQTPNARKKVLPGESPLWELLCPSSTPARRSRATSGWAPWASSATTATRPRASGCA